MYATCTRPNYPAAWVDRFFDEFERTASERASFRPKVDVVETSDAYLVRAELPGVARESLTVEVKENRLVLSGHKEVATQKEEGRYHYTESGSGSFSRAFDLPRKANNTNS